MWNGKSVSVVLPAFNEQEGVKQAIESFFATDVVDEIILVDNNSTDRTAEEAGSTAARIVPEPTQGYGAALIRGLHEATGEYVVTAEPDGTFDGSDLFKLLAYADDFPMVLGTRTCRRMIEKGAKMGWLLQCGNRVVAKLLQWLHGTCPLTDCGCTLRLIRREALEKILPALSVTQSHFLPETVILARKHGVRMIEVPVNYHIRIGTSKITGSLSGTFSTGWKMIRLIVGTRFCS
jgi:glycosyltransferase involved in cell wall biosynthesis